MFGKIVRRIRRDIIWMRNVNVQWGRVSPAQVVIFELDGNTDYILPLCGQADVTLLATDDFRLRISWEGLRHFSVLLMRGVSVRPAYYAALIRQMNPAIVITFVDNSELFWQVARVAQCWMRFLAIQNAARYDVVELPPSVARRIFLPEFVCFGEYEKDLYLGRGAYVGQFYPIGSLRESYFRRYRAASGQVDDGGGYDYDLCVVAEASPGWDRKYPGFEDAVGRIAQYAVRLAREKGLRVVIAGKRDLGQQSPSNLRDAEVIWYKQYIGDEVPITPRVRDQFTTYALVSRSRLSLAMISTVLREGMSRGKRVLFCNFSGNPFWDFCMDGIWSLKENSYEAFVDRVMNILAMSDEAYAALTEGGAKYVMNNDDENPMHEFIEKLIADAVAVKTSCRAQDDEVRGE